MSESFIIQKSTLTEIGDAIRSKTGGSEPIPVTSLAEEIVNLPTGGDFTDATATASDIAKGKTAYVSTGKVTGTAGASIKALIDLKGDASNLFENSQSAVDLREVLNYSDTENATKMKRSFYNCGNLQYIPLLDTKKVTTVESMFWFCKNLKEVPLFDFGNVTTMQSAFDKCYNIVTVPLFDTRNVTNMTYAFKGCSRLETVPLFDTAKVEHANNVFDGCPKLKTVPYLDFRSVTSATSILDGCYEVETCLVKNIKTNISISQCQKLTLESFIHLIYELRDTGYSRTLTIGGTNLSKLASTYVKLVEITDEMRAEDDLIDEKMPFVVCESTDEGAMLITDYPQLKNCILK
jgi:hypothetical protein